VIGVLDSSGGHN